MATTVTDRLGLRIQDAGDNPGTWEVEMNQGLQDADDRFFLSDAGDPNAEIHGGGSDAGMESVYVGQRYLDTDSGLWWTAQDIGAPGTWVSDQATLLSGIGKLTGVLSRSSNIVYQLLPAYGTIIYVEIDGVIVSHSGALSFDITADLFEGAEVASIPIYLYVENVDGVLTPQMSPVEPYDIGEAKPGYNQAENTYRCIGSCWNGADGHFAAASHDRDGWVRFNIPDQTDHVYDGSSELTLAKQADYRSLTLKVPKTASNVLLHVMGDTQDRIYMALAKSNAAIPTLPTIDGPWFLADTGLESALAILVAYRDNQAAVPGLLMPIAARSAPAMKYGYNHTDKTWDEFEIVLLAYQDMWAPKGY
jgi:hypothetical protein